MKSLKFMLLSALVMLGSSAFAIDVREANVGYVKDGVHAGTSADPYIVYVAAAYAEDNLTIKDAFTKANEMEVVENYKVVGFQANWTQVSESETKDIRNKLTTLTIQAKNMASLEHAFDGLGTQFVNLTVTSDADGHTDINFITSQLTDAQKEKITTLDFENLTKVTDGLAATLSKTAGFKALASVKLPKNVTALPDGFLAETKIATIALPAVCVEIGDGAFSGCEDLEAIDLTKVTSVGEEAFKGCKKITELEIPAGLVTVGDNAFADMEALATLTIKSPNAPDAFTGSEAVTTLNLQGVETIDDGAFAGMTITKIDLSKCPNLTTAAGKFKAGVALSKVKLAGSKVKLQDIDLTAAANSLKSITLSATADQYPIIANTFEGFTKLTSITIPFNEAEGKGVYSIGSEAFKGSALTAISLPAGIFVGANAFENCAALASAEIGDDVEISDNAFLNCAALATLTFGEADDDANSITIGKNAFEKTALEAVNLPANVSEIGDDAFKNCASLKTFVAAGLEVIPAAFEDCNKLKAVVLPKTVEVIDDYAFAGLPKLASVTFKHEGADDAESAILAYVGEGAFQDCVALTAIDLSKTQLAALDNDDVFNGCIALATITLPEEMNDLSGASIFEGTIIETLDASMVNGPVANIFGTDAENVNNTLKVLRLGGAVIANDAFAYCAKLKTVITGNYDFDGDPNTDDMQGATINMRAFAYCEKLATVTVAAPAVVNANAFDHCTALTTFTYKPEVLQLGDVDDQAFTGCKPFVLFDTNNNWVDVNPTAPLNTAYSAEVVATTVKTVQDKANANQFVNKFASHNYNVVFDADDVKIYSVYVDGENAYFQACRTYDGKYYVAADEHVILKTTEEKEVSYTIDGFAGDPFHASSVAFDDIQCLWADGDLADIQTALGMAGGQYLYRLTNTTGQGFGFTAYTKTDIKANQFFIATEKQPASGRLNTIWLDEDGNVEGEATAIKKIDSADANNGAIYNMQGVRVENAQKGIYIQNGKKFVVK